MEEFAKELPQAIEAWAAIAVAVIGAVTLAFKRVRAARRAFWRVVRESE